MEANSKKNPIIFFIKNFKIFQDNCHRNQRSMSLGGPAHESLLSKPHSQQPAQTIELSRGENGIFYCLSTSYLFEAIMLCLLWKIVVSLLTLLD